MKKAILVLLLSAGGFIAVWNFKPSPLGSVTVAQPAVPSASGSVAGSVESSEFGTVQVLASFDGTRISDIQLLRQPLSGRAVEALPQLRQEALKAQSAKVDTISGATQTSDSYIKSLQAAIDARG